MVFACMFSISATFSQVPLNNVVEHFTNTKCSYCATRNPGLQSNINALGNIYLIATHPSSPYSACLLSQQNKADNDARTKYYNVFGGTPVIVVNGHTISPASNYSSSATITPHLGNLTPFSLTVETSSNFNNSVGVRIVIKTEGTHALTGASLYVSLIEDTIVYTGSNGEPVHYNVSRKSVFAPQGLAVTLPVNIGDSVIYEGIVPFNNLWNMNRIKAIAILQKTDTKEVLQSQMSTIAFFQPLSLDENAGNTSKLHIYPNPSGHQITITCSEPYNKIIVNSSTGQQVMNQVGNASIIDISSLASGLYSITLYNAKNKLVGTAKFVKENK